MIQKDSGRIGTMLLEGLYIAPARILIYSCILEETGTDDVGILQTSRRDEFHIDWESLARILHGLIGLRNILGVGWLHRHDSLSSEHAIEACNRTRVATLHKLYPEDNKAGMGISTAHISDKLKFGRRMLIGVAVGFSGAIAERIRRPVKAIFPAIDILTIDVICKSGLGYPVFFSVANKR